MSITSQEGAASGLAAEEDSSTSLIDLTQKPAPSTETDPPRHVTTRLNRSSMAELSSLLESMYLDTPREDQQPTEDFEDIEAVSFVQQLQDQQLKIDALENRLKEAVDSTLNREEGLRTAIDAMAKEAKLYIDARLERFEQVVAACLERRDKQWGEDLEKTI